METLTTIEKRCSLKDHLSGQEIEIEKIELVLRAAMLAPSARNFQPWRFIVVQGKQTVEELTDDAFLGNNSVVKDAPVIIVVCARKEDDVCVDGKDYYLFDVGLAVENMLLAAAEVGLLTHLILRFDERVVKRILKVPEEYRVIITTPLAYPLEGSYDEAARDRLSKRTRKDFQEVVYFQHWDESVPEYA